LWAIELSSKDQPERSAEDNFRMVAEAGYDGLCVDPSAGEVPEIRKLKPLYEAFGLEAMVNAFPFTPDDMRPLYELATELQASQVNIIGGVMPIKPEDSVPLVRRWMQEAAAAGLPVLFETHRDSLLNDLYYTLQVIDLIPDMRLCADLSHFVVDREMREPIGSRDQGYIDRILDRSDCFQGRVANREQVQIQIEFPQHQEWVGIFRRWWKDGMRRWRQRNDDDATLIFLCELGPPPYAITDGNRRELSDRWEEALTIRHWVRDIWAELEAETRKTNCAE
ncbi:MAG: sugar phosphate isomerase/epimerase, partial [Gammaproteobacteria bacterium]|nr:sugar phosphate isomerase/epimerase [Gammaproteobacteria bacterium]